MLSAYIFKKNQYLKFQMPVISMKIMEGRLFDCPLKVLHMKIWDQIGRVR